MSPHELEKEKTRAWKFLALSLAGLLTLLVVVATINFLSPKKNGAGNTQTATSTERVTVETLFGDGGQLEMSWSNMDDSLKTGEAIIDHMKQRSAEGWVYCGVLPDPFAGTMVFQRRKR